MTKRMKKAVLLCGAGMIIAIYTCGCRDRHPEPVETIHPTETADVIHGEKFPSNEAVRTPEQFMLVQATKGARNDATLQPWHFDGEALNSAGEQKLDLMVGTDGTKSPIVVYLNLRSTDELTATRRDAIVRYLGDHGVADQQMKFVTGPNPATAHPTADELARMSKLESPQQGGTSETSSGPGAVGSSGSGGSAGSTGETLK